MGPKEPQKRLQDSSEFPELVSLKAKSTSYWTLLCYVHILNPEPGFPLWQPIKFGTIIAQKSSQNIQICMYEVVVRKMQQNANSNTGFVKFLRLYSSELSNFTSKGHLWGTGAYLNKRPREETGNMKTFRGPRIKIDRPLFNNSNMYIYIALVYSRYSASNLKSIYVIPHLHTLCGQIANSILPNIKLKYKLHFVCEVNRRKSGRNGQLPAQNWTQSEM